jgi:hypothetical protein
MAGPLNKDASICTLIKTQRFFYAVFFVIVKWLSVPCKSADISLAITTQTAVVANKAAPDSVPYIV